MRDLKDTGYYGDVFFYRAGDLHDNLYEENDQEIYDSFFDDGYSPNEAWDTLVWYLNVEIDDKGGNGHLTIVISKMVHRCSQGLGALVQLRRVRLGLSL